MKRTKKLITLDADEIKALVKKYVERRDKVKVVVMEFALGYDEDDEYFRSNYYVEGMSCIVKENK